jgi:2-amino-4-hydroxy-6-hydroxymethyldihydropteridine diphosphokinase
MHSVFLLTGSNLGDRFSQLQQCISALAEHAGAVVACSQVYETEAWGKEGLPAHLNQALHLHTALEPLALLEVIHDIEHKLGRVRQEKWGVRALDIDIIYFDHIVLNLPQLTIPHPLLQDRRFVLQPLAEIAPLYLHPVFGKTNTELLEASTDPLSVMPCINSER